METKKYVSKTALLGLVAVSAIIPPAITAYRTKSLSNKGVWAAITVVALINVAFVALVTIPITKKINVPE
jgi:hypothetical protein